MLRNFFAKAQVGDYFALQAYLTETTEAEEALQAICLRLRDRLHLTTTMGYGPRFLHSTGQFHKGGPDTGIFMQISGGDVEDVAIPDRPYTFAMFRRAQALGDLNALRKHGRRVMRIDIGADVGRGLADLAQGIEMALDGNARS